MRESKWVNAQVQLVGHVECRSPDPATLLNVGDRYIVNHKQVRQARAALSQEDREAIMSYLLREDEYVLRTGEDGQRYYKAIPPEMLDIEASAFRHLWHALADAGHVERKPPRPPRSNDTPATSNPGGIT